MSEDPRNDAVVQNVEKLVKCLTGDDFSSAQRRTLEHNALLKIRNHRNMSTSSHEVRRAIDNMIDRFCYEGMVNQADAVRHLSALIMDHDSWKTHYEVDVQYSVIDFLLQMTYEPIQTVRRNRSLMDQRLLAVRDALRVASKSTESVPKPEPNCIETEIDWVALLKEDFIKLPSTESGSESNLSDWSDEASSSESLTSQVQDSCKTSLEHKKMAEVYSDSRLYPSGTNTFLPEPSRNINGRRKKKNFTITQPKSISFSGLQNRGNWCIIPRLMPMEPPTAPKMHTDLKIVVTRFSRSVHSHWWNQKVTVNTQTPNDNPCDNFAIAYVQHLNRHARNLPRHPLPKTMKETCLIREIIFMFFEPVSCCFFEVGPEPMQISVRPYVSICNVSSVTLRRVLELDVVPAVKAMQQLRQIIKDLTTHTSYEPSTGTLEYFAVGLKQLIQPMIQSLIVLERQLLDTAANKAESNLTLIKFVRQMEEQFHQLKTLQLMASKAIIKAPPYLRSAYLLSQLFKQTRVHVPHQKMATALLLTTLKRYCGIIDSWWRHAELEDWRNEYIVECYRDMWVPAGQSIRERCLPADVAQAHHEILEELKGCSFYKLLMTYALESGETQDLLANINLLGDLVNSSQRLGSLHSDLIHQLFEELKKFGSDTCAVGQRGGSVLELACQELELHDGLVANDATELGNLELMNLFTLQTKFEQKKPSPMEHTTQQPQVFDVLKALEKCSPMQLPQLVPRALSAVLRQRCQLANVYVMRWYRDELLLGQHVRFLRHLFLLEADYLLYPFYTRLFRQVESGQKWANHSLLTSELYDTLDNYYPGMAGEVTVEIISQSRAKSDKVYEAMDAIGVDYTMPPALCRIITNAHMTVYNAVWRLILKVKWAAWKLENMHFIRRASKGIYAPLDLLGLTLRRLEMIRFWLIYLVNSVHTHLCTHVMQAIGGQFEGELKQMETIRQLAELHNDYLAFLAKHCLITNDFKEFRIALDQIFHLVYVLDMEWKSCGNYLNESHALSLDLSCDEDIRLNDTTNLDENERNRAMEYLALNQVAEIESTYIRCHQMLANILTTLVFKNDFKFLNSLEVAINSSQPC